MGTYGATGLAGDSALPSLGDCSRVCSFMAMLRNSSRMGGKLLLASVCSEEADVVVDFDSVEDM